MYALIGKLGNNFLVAAFVPSLWFVVSAQVMFSPFDPTGLLTLSTDIFSGKGFVTLILTLLIGFTLMGLNTFIYKLLEGYYLLEKITFMQKRQYRKALRRRLEFEWRDRLALRLRRMKKKLKEEADKEKKEAYEATMFRLRQESNNLKAQYKQDYPEQTKGVLPTRFGNILKSFELYSLENYRMDSVTMWPRLIHVIDPEYYVKVDQSNNGLAFIVNCMTLSVVLSFLCLLASGYKLAASRMDIHVGESAPWGLFLVASGSLLTLAFFFYYASLPAARQYGNMVRSSFDLFRFDLLKQLRLPLPQNAKDERVLWTKLSSLYGLGIMGLGPKLSFSYVHNRDQEKSDNDSESCETEATLRPTDRS